MSLTGLLTMRCRVKRLTQTDSDGVPTYTWKTVASDIPCRLDLTFQRAGKDFGWSQEAGRSPDRAGVLFVLPGANMKSGDRIQITKGLAGTFEIDGAIDQAYGANGVSHLEIGVTEVAQQVSAP